MTPVLLLALLAPSDTLLVEVRLNGVGSVVVEAVLDADSLLHLPTRDVAGLFETAITTAPTVTPADLQLAFPLLTVHWDPRELRVLVDDPQATLPASRRQREHAQRRAMGGPTARVTQSGPFLAFAADARERSVLDVGYSWRGLVAVAARRSSTTGTTWNVGLAPSPILFASVSGAHAGISARPQITSASARLAVGPAWVNTAWTPQSWYVDGLATVGPVSIFASSREVFLITIKSHGADFQVGRNSADLTAFRVSVGPFRSSPFLFPQTF